MDLVDLNLTHMMERFPQRRRDPYGSRGSKLIGGIVMIKLIIVEILMDLVDLNSFLYC